MGWGANPAGVQWQTDPAHDADFTASLGRGRIALPTVNVPHTAHLPYEIPDVDLVVNVQTSQTAAGGWIVGYVRVRDTGARFVAARVEYHEDGQMGVLLYESVDGDATSVAAALIGTYTPNSPTVLRMQVRGVDARVKTWALGAREPEHWQVGGRLQQVLTPGRVGLGAARFNGNTNTNLEVSWGALHIANPQQFTVIRGTNNVHKAHSAGTGLRLAHPSVIAL
ncbi:hypothetical protein [Saccharomonospora viridis]|uniref:hypothetical protein n=1 Tax=Saccharomonospora viridis TaxID=1852 RepID=UPI00240A626D|nr:hypothetical protein [Saccharomonospora viridis]